MRVSNHCVAGKIMQGNLAAIYIIVRILLFTTFKAGRMEISDSSALLILRYPFQEHSSTHHGVNATIKAIFK